MIAFCGFVVSRSLFEDMITKVGQNEHSLNLGESPFTDLKKQSIGSKLKQSKILINYLARLPFFVTATN